MQVEHISLPLTRRRWQLAGQVQGVGFRPLVFRLAQQHQLSGRCGNDQTGLWIEAQGSAQQLEEFAKDLIALAPPLAKISRVDAWTMRAIRQEEDFNIEESRAGGTRAVQLTSDSAVCENCLREMRDRGDRHYGYALINCTDCGPRYSIITATPYDRANTTMAGFTLCPGCAAEYADPRDRRFHAQPTACARCGPGVWLQIGGKRIDQEPIKAAADLLAAGKILAIKGLGAFHLACRADDQRSVLRLRQGKQRDAKPLALMVDSVQRALQLADFSALGLKLMQSPAAPIVLANRRSDAALAEAVAPGQARLGVMLASTPLHHLLLDQCRGFLGALVMTSGNRHSEPPAIDNAEAMERLGDLCDGFLMHSRPIARCVDDSVVLDMGDEAPLPLRVARGMSPGRIGLRRAFDQPGLCVGGELKNTVAVARADEVVCSQHVGDLSHPLALEHFERTIADLLDLLEVKPRWIAHDRHPDYLSTHHARQLAKQWQADLEPVQHHHAHAAALLAEWKMDRPALCLVCDGVGYGTDGSSWGAELLRVDPSTGTFERLGSLTPLDLPGGDAAAKDVRRCAAGWLAAANRENFHDLGTMKRLFPDNFEKNMIVNMLQHRVNCVSSSAAGRLFDAAAALLGICRRNDFEAQAPMALEAAAMRNRQALSDEDLFEVVEAPTEDMLGRDDERHTAVNGAGEQIPARLRRLDFSSLCRWIWQTSPVPAQGAAMFHEQFARGWARLIGQVARQRKMTTIGLSGGVMANALLCRRLEQLLVRQGLKVLRHRLLSPGDGSIAVGQAAVARARRQTSSITNIVKPMTVEV